MAAPAPITFDTLKRRLSAGQYAPVYLLHGEEGYYIDELVKLFERILPAEDREYGLVNLYAPQISNPKEITDVCRTMPMLTDRQVVIVREAQSAKGDFIDKLAPYAASPTPSTILVVSSRGEKIKGKEFIKAVKTNGVVYESPKVWPNEVPGLAMKFVQEKGLTIEPQTADLLAEYIGTSLSRLHNEIDKLAGILGRGAKVTPEAIEMHIGISKDYNNFELLDALATRDGARAMRIVNYFANNPKANPYVVTTSTLFGFFADLMQAYYTPGKNERDILAALGINPYNRTATARIRNGMKSYNPFQLIEILDVLRRYDATSKGIGSRMNPYDGLADVIFHILTAPGTLPV